MVIKNIRKHQRTVSQLLSTCLPAAILISLGLATMSVHSDPSSSEASAEAYKEGWWRHIRQGTWIWEGADWEVVAPALDRMKAATGKRRYIDKYDTILEYGPGHWTYEWNRIADSSFKKGVKYEALGDRAAALKAYMQSSIYYTQASYPHTKDKHSRQALKKAFKTYRKAGEFFQVPLETWDFEVDGVKFSALIHMPANASNDPVPVVVRTSGMDVVSTEFYQIAETLNNAGVAKVVFDAPGTGNDGVVDANYEKHHLAVLNRVWKDKRFDQDRIAVWSDSLAGGVAVKLAAGEHRDRIAAAVNNCGVIHAGFNMDLFGEGAQSDKSKLIYAYKNNLLSKEQIDSFKQLTASSEAKSLSQHFQGELLFERVGASPDDLLDFLSKTAPVSLVNQGIVGKKNITNTPLLVINTHFDPFVPHQESIMAAEVSIQGKLMIVDEYDGHCISRSDLPMILEWLSYHLKVSELSGYVEVNRKKL